EGMKTLWIWTISLMCTLLACQNSGNENTLADQPQAEEAPIIHFDSLSATYPTQIANDKGFVEISGVQTFEDEQLVGSEFTISLNDIADHPFSKTISIDTLIAVNELESHQDTLDHSYFDGAVIRSISYRSVRANTLYFDLVLQNASQQKEVIGRFNLFYRTKKEGKVYGWFADSIVAL
ncbi:MAG: hypothetical protein AAF544_12210, partial [Bacteroidota bacterium]